MCLREMKLKGPGVGIALVEQLEASIGRGENLMRRGGRCQREVEGPGCPLHYSGTRRPFMEFLLPSQHPVQRLFWFEEGVQDTAVGLLSGHSSWKFQERAYLC